MRSSMLIILAALAAIAAEPIAAQQTRTAIAGAPRPAARVSDLRWLAGSWRGQGLYGPAREVYSPPMGGQITGHFVQKKGAGVGFMEIMSIAEVDGSLEYRLKHFHPDLAGWEERAEVVRFPLIAVERDSWHFDGLTIRREGPDRMTAIVRIRGEDGATREAVFRYTRER